MLHSDATRHTLGFARIVISSIWLLVCIQRPLLDLAVLPVELFLPRGLLLAIPEAAWPTILSGSGLLALKVVLILLTAMMVAGIGRWRLVSWTALSLLALHQGIYRGFGGHVNHRELALLYATIVLAAFPATDGLAWKRKRRSGVSQPVYALGMLGICLSVTLTYVFIGVARLFTSGIAPFNTNAITCWVAMHSFLDSQFGFEYGRMVLDVPWLAEMLKWSFPAATLLEIVSPLALFSRKFRLVWVVGFILPFHAGIMLLMNIVFVENCLLMLLFYNVTPLLDRLCSTEGVAGAGGVEASGGQ
jgi:hypothetical protein